MTDRAKAIAARIEGRRPWMGPRRPWWGTLRPVAECIRTLPDAADSLLRIPAVQAALHESLLYERRMRRSWRRILRERRHLLGGLLSASTGAAIVQERARTARDDVPWRRYRLYASLAATGYAGRPADQHELPDHLRTPLTAADDRERWRLALRGARLLRAHALLAAGGADRGDAVP